MMASPLAASNGGGRAPGRLFGQVALVTGASRGIGRACTLAFAREGARVAALARTSQELDRLAAEIRDLGGEALALAADVTDQVQVERAFDQAEQRLGAVQVLLNNAAVLGPSEHVVRVDPSAWLETYLVNAGGPMLCARRALPAMIEQRRGKIINVSSGAALAAIPGYTAYSSSKAALLHFTVCLAEEVRPFNVNVNCVGVWARTSMWEEQLEAEPMPAVAQAAARGLKPTAEDNLAAILFLASADSDHVTGQYLAANSL